MVAKNTPTFRNKSVEFPFWEGWVLVETSFGREDAKVLRFAMSLKELRKTPNHPNGERR